MNLPDTEMSAPIHALLRGRWSGRAYDASRDIPRDALQTMAEAGRWAPSCFNEQPWRVLFCQRSAQSDAWNKAFDCLWPLNQAWCQTAPVFAIICARIRFSHNEEPNPWAIYDAGAAALSICLQASALDMMAHQMGGFDPDKTRELFNIPAPFTPTAIMAIGYPATVTSAEAPEKAAGPRTRKPLSEHFFIDDWGKGL